MSTAQRRGLDAVLDDAEGLARVLRAMSDGKLDLVVVSNGPTGMPLPLSWGEARTDALRIAGGAAGAAGAVR